MKVLSKQNIKNDIQKRHTLTEKYILQCNNSNFIVKLHYSFQDKQRLYFVLDYMKGGKT